MTMASMNPVENHQIDPELLMTHPRLRQLLWEGRFGLEKEHVRCTADGHLALSPHPEVLGNKADHPYITTDFSESQIEMITPPMPSLREAHGFMQTLHQLVNQALPEGELLWMQSMPPVLPDESLIPVAQFEGSSRYKTEYRERLSAIYGRGRQMISGSHFNISLTSAFFEEYARVVQQPVVRTEEPRLHENGAQPHAVRWWLVAALGRSPVADPSLKLKAFDSDQLFSVCCAFGISIRSSRIGYRNPHPLETSYSSLASYLESLDAHICSGKLLNRNELYMPVRLKLEPGSSVISHLEIRLLDLDPLDPVGLPLDSLYLIHQFCIFCLLEPETDAFDLKDQQRADELQNRVAVAGFSPKAVARCCELIQSVELLQDALRLFNKLENILSLQPTHLPDGDRMRAALEKFGRVFREQNPIPRADD
jgi:glutamate--cysteine ligase